MPHIPDPRPSTRSHALHLVAAAIRAISHTPAEATLPCQHDCMVAPRRPPAGELSHSPTKSSTAAAAPGLPPGFMDPAADQLEEPSPAEAAQPPAGNTGEGRVSGNLPAGFFEVQSCPNPTCMVLHGRVWPREAHRSAAIDSCRACLPSVLGPVLQCR